jgi:hypothetical protein
MGSARSVPGGAFPALRALAVRLAADVDAAEYAADLSALSRTLRIVLISIHAAELRNATAPTGLDELVSRRKRRATAGNIGA